MSRRKSSFKQRCFQILGVAVLLYGTAILLHFLFTLVFWTVGRR